ncbi:MAG TPA: hypothetical protein VFV33_16040 [Gemmatimonadaceae bacterium]|nr:hypothetical protein [Gemmatimonadaceae bacterium]
MRRPFGASAAILFVALAGLAPVPVLAQRDGARVPPGDTVSLEVAGAKVAIVKDGQPQSAPPPSAGASAQGQAPTAPAPPRPSADSLVLGGRVIAAGTTVRGPVVVAGGDLVVLGTIAGTAVAIAGDVDVRPGGRVTGDAIAAFGEVHAAAGSVGGDMRSLTGRWGESLRSTLEGDGLQPTKRSPLQLALGWFAVMLLIGLGVLVFASSYLDGVVDVLEQSFWRSFFVGIAGELGIFPAMLLLVVALAVTILGALLIPFAVVAFVLAVAGLATLGFIAVAQLTGGSIGGRAVERLSARGSALRAVIVGVSLYMGLWLVATAMGSVPAAGIALRLVAVLVTYVAVTAGFGAALLSRGGTRRDAAVAQAAAPAMNAASWQTPTPVTGVVAARRPAAGTKGEGSVRTR